MLWLECNAAELNGVSFTKGCYVGQENTARMNWRAKVNRRLVVVPLDRARPGTTTRGLSRTGAGGRSPAGGGYPAGPRTGMAKPRPRLKAAPPAGPPGPAISRSIATECRRAASRGRSSARLSGSPSSQSPRASSTSTSVSRCIAAGASPCPSAQASCTSWWIAWTSGSSIARFLDSAVQPTSGPPPSSAKASNTRSTAARGVTSPRFAACRAKAIESSIPAARKSVSACCNPAAEPK